MANKVVLNEVSYHGKGAILSVTEEAKRRGFKKAFICSDPDLIKFNVTKKVTDLLDKEGLPYEINKHSLLFIVLSFCFYLSIFIFRLFLFYTTPFCNMILP